MKMSTRAAARTVTNMESSLTVPTATSMTHQGIGKTYAASNGSIIASRHSSSIW